MVKIRRKVIVCRGCRVHVEHDWIADDDLLRLRMGFAKSCESTAAPRPQPVPVICPWCGVGELALFYYPIGITSSGSVGIRFSSYAPSEISNGMGEIEPTHEDYQLWVWIARRRKRFYRIHDDQLESLRGEFQAWQRGWVPWLLHRLMHRQRSGVVQSLGEIEG
jgi:hypothetical protein